MAFNNDPEYDSLNDEMEEFDVDDLVDTELDFDDDDNDKY